DDVHVAAGAFHIGQLSNVAVNAFDAERFERRGLAAHECSHSIAASDELLDDILAEKPAGAGHEAGQLTFAGCCRPILLSTVASRSGSGNKKGFMLSSVLGPMPRTRRSSAKS